MADVVLLVTKAFIEGYARSDGTFVRPHTDRRPTAQPDLFPRKPTGGDQAIAFPYASGMSRKRDMAAAIESTAGVGTVIDEISRPGMEVVADAIAAGKPFFVDSGAFQAFKAAMRERKPEKAMRDFDKVFARYDELSRLVCERAPGRLERGLLMMVAPDVIGDQTATLKLLEKHADQVNAWIERGHEVIIPFQRGALTQSQAFKRVGEILGHHMFVVGIPTAAAAMSNEELHELLSQPYKPDRLHILGGVSSDGFHSRMAVIRGAYEDEVPGVTADANVMRSRLHELHGIAGQEKFEAIQRILNRVVPDIWGGEVETGGRMHKAIRVERIQGPGEPSAAQLASGRYPKRKVPWKGLTLRIENEAGTYRRGRGPEGEWETLMHFAYGEVERTEGVDGDPVDVFLGPYMDTAPMVYVVHQRKVRDWDKYDEDKCMLGFESEADATAAFLSSYSDSRFLGPITAMPVEEFVAKVKATRDAPAMIKAQIAGYTKKDGTYVAPHSDRRPSAPEPEAHFAHVFADPGIQAIAKAADAALSGDAARAIDGFIGVPHDALEMGVAFGFMSARYLEDAYGASPSERGSAARAQIDAAFAPTREALRRRVGDTVTLYRVQGKVDVPSASVVNMSAAPDGSRSVLSWTSDPEFARDYAGVKPTRTLFSEADIARFEAELERAGQVKISNRWLAWEVTHGFHFVTKQPVTIRTLGIYYGDKHPNLDEGMITDTDSVREFVEGINRDRAEANAASDARAQRLITATVPLNEVVWISNRAGQSEFIVRNRPGGVFVGPDGKLKTPRLLLSKSLVEGHQRRLADGRVVYVLPYSDRRLKHQPELFADAPKAKRPDPEKVVFLKPSAAPAAQLDLFAPLESKSPATGKAAAPDLASYDKILVAFSGGKDSLAALLALIEAGVPTSKIELHHHDIDGDGRSFMDWPITKAYCKAIAKAFGIPIYFSWREGGFEREMTRKDERTAAVHFETPEGVVRQAGGEHGPLGTRRKFPQVSADLKTRWCSGKLKIDVMDTAIRNQDRFNGVRTLVVTGERAQESSNRAKYKTFEPHRSKSGKRHVDQYRPVHGWKEEDVWDIMRRHGVVPHPAYQLGWGRLSCRTCIFGSPNQWATIRELYPEHFKPVADYEKDFGVTIHRTQSVDDRADKGKPYEAAVAQKELAAMANGHEWHGDVLVPPEQWKLPAGAFGEKDGPC